MPVNAHLLPPPSVNHHATAGDRQEAARQAYRQSVADGKPLTGVELGRRFDRSPRWGTSRIAEVRTEDIAPNDGNTTSNPALPIRNDGNRSAGNATSDNNGPLPITNHGTGNNVRPAGAANTARGNGRDAGDAAVPIGNGIGSPLPISNNGNHAHAKPPADTASSGTPRPPAGEPPTGDDILPVTPGVRRITTAAVLAVALVAAVVSFEHQRELAALAGEGWRSWALPISVDGLVVAASMTMLTRRRASQPAGTLAWFALALGLGASLAANVVAADPSVVDPALLRRLVAGWSPLALALGFELSLQQLRTKPARRTGR